MTVKQVEKIVHHEPFVPYRLVLRDGEVVTVNRPRKSSVSGDQVALVGMCRRSESSPQIERFRIIRIERIAAAEHIADARR